VQFRIRTDPGVVSNNSQCQITRIRATAHAQSRKVSYAGVYLFLGLGLVLGLSLGLIIPTSSANLVLRVIWQCDIFGTTPVLILNHIQSTVDQLGASLFL